MSKNYKDVVRPTEYEKKKFITALKIGSQIAFVLYFKSQFQPFWPWGVFSAMCLNWYITEAIADVLSKRNDDFMNKEQLIIQTAYPDFVSSFSDRLWIDEEPAPIKEKQDENIHTDTWIGRKVKLLI